MHCTKISSELEFGVKGQRSRSPGTKNDKVRHFFGSGPQGHGPRGPYVRCMFGKNILSIAGAGHGRCGNGPRHYIRQ